MDLKELKTETGNIVTKAHSYAIKTNEDYESGAEFLKAIKTLKKKIDETFKPIIEKNHAAWKEAIAQSKKQTDPLINAEAVIKEKIASYLHECELKRREEQRRLEEIAKRKAEEEALKEAARAETKEEAEEIIQEAIDNIPVVIVEKIEPKIEGISNRKINQWRLTNEREVKKEFLMVDEKKINAMVRSLGKQAEAIVGGIQVYEESIISARGF